MRTTQPHVRKYRYSSTSRFVVEGIRINGKRNRKFFSTRVEAETYCQQLRVEIQNLGRNAFALSNSERLMAADAIKRLQPTGKPLSEAIAEYTKAFQKLSPRWKTILDAVSYYCQYLDQNERSCTVSKLIQEFLKNKMADGRSYRYLNDLRIRLERFKQDFGNDIVAGIHPRELDDWLRSLELSPQSRKNYRTVLRVFFSYAVDRGYATNNPVDRTASPRIIGKAPEIFRIEDAKSLLEHADPELAVYLAIGLFAGVRVAELDRLDWSEVDLAGGYIHVGAHKAKTARRRLIRIEPNLAAWLALYTKQKGSIRPINLRPKLLDLRQKAGITKWPGNGMRHSFASYHLAHFKDAAKTALELGHTDTGILFEHYREVVKTEVATRYWNIFPSQKAAIVPFAKAEVA